MPLICRSAKVVHPASTLAHPPGGTHASRQRNRLVSRRFSRWQGRAAPPFAARARLIIVRSVVRIHPELFSHLRSFRLPYATPAQTGSEPQRRDRLNYSQPAYHVGVGGQGHCGEWPSCSASSGSGMPRLVLKRSQRVSGGTATCLRRLRVSGAMPSSLSRPSEPANVAGSDQN
jgi:hypothetical protein